MNAQPAATNTPIKPVSPTPLVVFDDLGQTQGVLTAAGIAWVRPLWA